MSDDSAMVDDVKAALDKLWATTIESYSHDLLQNTCTFELSASSGGETTRGLLQFEDIRSLTYQSDIGPGGREPWNYAELTAIEAELFAPARSILSNILPRQRGMELENLWRVSIEVWTDTLEITCGVVRVDGRVFGAQTGA